MRPLFLSFLLLFSLAVQGQSASEVLKFARAEIDTLCSTTFAGRGYIDNGHRKAATYLAHRFQEMGAESMREQAAMGIERYFQPFDFSINLIKKTSLSLNGQKMKPGLDYIVNSYSGNGLQQGKVLDLKYGLKPKASIKGKIVLFRAGWPAKIANDSEKREAYKALSRVDQRIAAILAYQPRAIIVIQPKLTASFARETLPLPIVEVRAESITRKVKKAAIFVEAGMTQINSQNVICQVRGTEQPDSVIIVSAHYDHLGMQGSSIFPGANDNASGTSMLLSMVEYFVKHPQRYTMVFIAFGAEETGLIGSNYYVNRSPVVALSQTRFILNIDLMGNGIDGITAVGGRDFPNYFERLVALNDTMQSVPKVKSRSNAPNSDHYFFLKNGVPGFFIYTLGGPPHYHDINDNPSTIVLSRYAEVRELLIKYLELLNA
ncbi:MAG: M28 family peptidase [Bacteroidota bacterium]